MKTEFASYREGAAWQIIRALEEKEEARSLRIRAKVAAFVIMTDHGKREGGKWFVSFEHPLSPAMLVRLDLESLDDVENPEDIRSFKLRFDFASESLRRYGNGTAEISNEGVKNFQGENAEIADLRQIVSCLDFVKSQKGTVQANSPLQVT